MSPLEQSFVQFAGGKECGRNGQLALAASFAGDIWKVSARLLSK
jgi:hypothetical protein